MKCKRCGHTKDEHVFTELSQVHACKRCTCDQFVGDDEVGKLYDAPWGRYEVYGREGDKITLKQVGVHSYVVLDAVKLAADYQEASFRVPPPTPRDAAATTKADPAGATATTDEQATVPTVPTGQDRDRAPATSKRSYRKGGVGLGARRERTATTASPGGAPEVAAPSDGPLLDLFRVDAVRSVRSDDDLHPDFRPLGVEPVHAAAPAAATSAPVRHLGLDLDDDRAARAARGWVAPALTLGAVRPGGALISVPDRLLQYWLPCANPEDGQPHAWFIADNLAPSIYCDDCREQRPSRRVPEAASIPADHPRAQAWSLWQWDHGGSRDVDGRPSSAEVAPSSPVATGAVPPSREPPLRRTGLGRPPWDDDPRGPIWEWAEIGLKARVVAREVYEERAAIQEYDAGLTREEAEYRSYGALLLVHQRHYGSAA